MFFYAQIPEISFVLMAAPELIEDLLMIHPAIIGPSRQIRFIQCPFHGVCQPGIGFYTHHHHSPISILRQVHRLPTLYLLFYF